MRNRRSLERSGDIIIQDPGRLPSGDAAPTDRETPPKVLYQRWRDASRRSIPPCQVGGGPARAQAQGLGGGRLKDVPSNLPSVAASGAAPRASTVLVDEPDAGP